MCPVLQFGLQIAGVFLPLASTALQEMRTRTNEFQALLLEGQVEKVEEQLKKAPYLKDSRDEFYGRTPLHQYISENNLDMVKRLLEIKANANMRDIYGFTPLHLASDPEIARLLIPKTSSLELTSFCGTPLEHVAYRWAHAFPVFPVEARRLRSTAKVLLDAGANYTIMAAVYFDDAQRVRAILKNDPNQALDKSRLLVAAQFRRADIVKQLLDHRADPNAIIEVGEYPALYLSLEYPEIVRLLLKAGADSKALCEEMIEQAWGQRDRMTMLHHAAKKGFVESAKYLIEAGADVNSHDSNYHRTPLRIAVDNGRLEMVKLLLAKKASVEGDEGSRALEAVFDAFDLESLDTSRSIIKVLGETGIPLNTHAYVLLGDIKKVRKELKERPGLAESLFADKTPLIWAVLSDQVRVVATLLDGGASISGTDELGSTALHWAALDGRDEVAELLINRRADVNARDKSGSTPLHQAARRGSTSVAKLLLEAGADVNAREKNGETPLDSADKSNKEMIELLKKHGAK